MTATTLAPADQRFILHDVDWSLYDSMLRGLGDQHIFLTYDRGRLELMSPSWKHDKLGRRIGLLILFVADALDQPIEGGGSTTFRRQDLERGLEPDQCFYIQNVNRVRGKEQIDLSVDPPPDLAIEVEVVQRLLDRVAIYAALGIPELWRYDGEHLRVFTLQPDGTYAQRSRSTAFPTLPLNEVERLLDLAWQDDEVTWIRAVQAWMRDHLRQPENP